MKSKPVRIHVMNDAEAIKGQLAHWRQSHLLETKAGIFGPISAGLVTCAVRNLQAPVKGHAVVASILLYRSKRAPDLHVEMVYALCSTPQQIQAASRAIEDIVGKVKSSLHLPIEVLLNRGKN
jgi:hypothetical protein